jgi:putative iron-regulated protein
LHTLLKPALLGISLLAAHLLSTELHATETKPLTDTKQVVEHYGELAFAVFSDAKSAAETLQNKTDALINTPSDATLNAARQAWLAARIPYLQSEVFRFGNKVVDDAEGQLNAWPLDEGLIDYVVDSYSNEMGNPAGKANIIANPKLNLGSTQLDVSQLTPAKLAELNTLGGSEANVATGYHAVEFLLWGQDLNGHKPGAGNRPFTDYAKGKACTHDNCERRGAYLKAAVALLVSDLAKLQQHFAPNQANYRASLALKPTEGLSKMFIGMGSLSLGEMAGERMKVGLEANSTEDEQDCFSDNTHNAHFYDGKGISNLYFGRYQRLNGTLLSGPALSDLVRAKNPAQDTAMQQALSKTDAALKAMVDKAEQPKDAEKFDQLIAPNNAPGKALVNAAIQALVAQTKELEKAAKTLGIDQLNVDAGEL